MNLCHTKACFMSETLCGCACRAPATPETWPQTYHKTERRHVLLPFRDSRAQVRLHTTHLSSPAVSQFWQPASVNIFYVLFHTLCE